MFCFTVYITTLAKWWLHTASSHLNERKATERKRCQSGRRTKRLPFTWMRANIALPTQACCVEVCVFFPSVGCATGTFTKALTCHHHPDHSLGSILRHLFPFYICYMWSQVTTKKHGATIRDRTRKDDDELVPKEGETFLFGQTLGIETLTAVGAFSL